MWGSKPATCYSQGTHNSVSQGRWMPCGETKKIPIWSYWMEVVTGKFQQISRYLYNFQFTLFKQKKWPDIVAWSDSKKCPPHRIVCPLERKPGGGTQMEEKPIRDTVCRRHGKGLDMPCDSYCCGFLGYSVILFLSKIGITSRSLKVALKCLQPTAQYALSWIWLRAKSL